MDAKPAADALPFEVSEQNPEEQSKIVGEAMIVDDAPVDAVEQEKPE